MEDDKTLIESVVDDYVEAGLATAKDEVTLVSLDGENEVVLEPLFSGDEQSGVRIVSNGNELAELSFDDADFSSRFSTLMHGELNV